jgi:membrane protein implicated in regulation of membrane protease activity
MSKESLVFVIGIIVFFTPFLGLPTSYKEWIFTGTGVLLIITGYRLRRRAFLRSLEVEGNERRGDAFVESRVEIKEEKEHTNGVI